MVISWWCVWYYAGHLHSQNTFILVLNLSWTSHEGEVNFIMLQITPQWHVCFIIVFFFFSLYIFFKVVDFLCNVVCKQLFIFLMLLYIHSFSCNLTYCVALRQIGYMVLAQYFYIANNTWWVMWLLSSWLILLPQPFSGTHFRLSAHDIFLKCSSQVIFEHITTELVGKHEAYV